MPIAAKAVHLRRAFVTGAALRLLGRLLPVRFLAQKIRELMLGRADEAVSIRR